MTLLLLVLALHLPEDSAVSENERRAVADGMEKTFAALQSKKLRLVRVKSKDDGRPDSPDAPDRREFLLVIAADGKVRVETVGIENGRVVDRREDTWDGAAHFSAGKSGGRPTLQIGSIVAPGKGATLLPIEYSSALSLAPDAMKAPYCEILRDPARVTASTMVAKVDWRRVPVSKTLLDATIYVSADGRRFWRLRIDPEHGFWPTSLQAGEVRERKTEELHWDFAYSDFKQTDGVWYPGVVKIGKTGLFGAGTVFVTLLEAGRDYPVSLFRLEAAPGTKVRDLSKGMEYVVGESSVNSLKDVMGLKKEARPAGVEMAGSRVGINAYLIVSGLGLLLIVVLLVALRHMRCDKNTVRGRK